MNPALAIRWIGIGGGGGMVREPDHRHLCPTERLGYQRVAPHRLVTARAPLVGTGAIAFERHGSGFDSRPW